MMKDEMEVLLGNFLTFVDFHSVPADPDYDKSFTIDDLYEYIPYYVKEVSDGL